MDEHKPTSEDPMVPVTLTASEGPEDREEAREASIEGPVLPGYVPQRLLGEGAFGQVWASLQTRTGQSVAVKVLSRRANRNWQLFQRELESLRSVGEHPFIVTLIDADLNHDPPYLVMPLLSRGSLGEMARDPEHLPPVEHVVEWFEQVAAALQYVHRKGILHCDLKPANLLLDEEGTARVADFGQAHLIGEQELSLGTLWYMSPEQTEALEDSSHVVPDVGWDVYSLGATVYRLLTGHAPRASEEGRQAVSRCHDLAGRLRTYREVSRQPLVAVQSLNSSVDPELSSLVERCLLVDPEQRLPDMGAILQELERRKQRPSLEQAWLGLLRSGCEAGGLMSIIGFLAVSQAHPAVLGGALLVVGLWFAHRFGLLGFVTRVVRQEVTDRRSPLFFAIGSLTLVCFILTVLQEYQTTGAYATFQRTLGVDLFGRVAFVGRYFVAGFVTSLFLLVLSPGCDQRTSFSWVRLKAAALLLLLASVVLLMTKP